jgi:hypothetical protein
MSVPQNIRSGSSPKKSVEGLVAVSEDVRTGRLIVSRLEYTQAQQRLSSVHEIAECRVALVMDQWDETRDSAPAKAQRRPLPRTVPLARLTFKAQLGRKCRKSAVVPTKSLFSGLRMCR